MLIFEMTMSKIINWLPNFYYILMHNDALVESLSGFNFELWLPEKIPIDSIVNLNNSFNSYVGR